MATTTLLSKHAVAEGTMAFTFAKPTGFESVAGQFIDITLVNPPETDAEGNTRAFSIVSAPQEDAITITTRMRDTAFKRVLGNMEPGTEVEISDAMGSFTLHKNVDKAAIFLMGGVGITPTMGILRDAIAKQLPHKLFLFYSNRRPEDSAYLEELKSMGSKNPHYTFIGTMTEMDKSAQPWDGETGYITADMVKKHVSDDIRASAIWYVSGPPAMVKAMRTVMTELGVDEDNVKTEEFSGY
ncbi:MAG: hypothetical protein RL141_41 [Candidatus Parcubacteria bacterium]|jgi:ferredoxin-NADP reductase